jgi:hypothetical protein
LLGLLLPLRADFAIGKVRTGTIAARLPHLHSVEGPEVPRRAWGLGNKPTVFCPAAVPR